MTSNTEDAEQQRISNKRRASREQVKIFAELLISAGPRFKVTVLDLSSTGFRIQTANFVPMSRKIYLTIPEFQTLQGTVAWNDRELYGCKFSQPLHTSIYTHLASRFPQLVS